MTNTVLSPPPAPVEPRHRWLPFGDRSRSSRLRKVLAWLAGLVLVLVVLELLGVDVLGWFSDLWDALSAIGFGYLVAGWTLQSLKTGLTAFAWYSILRVAFPAGRVAFLQILAAYAAGVALNGFLPANLGTVVTLLMYVAIIPGANLPGVLGGMVVHKIFFSFAGAFVYVYLIVSASGSLDIDLPDLGGHPVLLLGALAGAALLLVILGRTFWRKLRGLWAEAVQGGAILAQPREYALKVALPSFGAWLAKLGVIAVFLAGYGITVTFHTVMSVVGSGSIANVVSVTPGGVGVNQAADVAALSGVTDTATATAYSIGQQLAITAWNVAFALVLVVWAFGWTGGKLLVEQSYADAKVKVEEQKVRRAETKATKRAR
ncbi:flippase-like domain-containing protein [Solirubrobacter ginsenosidimutans]|uniref:Flippase-like domain-containing protein n=1 Tax=Solirubrobacter ginsenosidimutans TaxID=490573 RepID=A0A9X3MMM4_9ACTN|nr:lysylphosphatidylglycerol synthase domain-containing protein [Solirubrobacter ginsenosidimutans]MDA0158967.1 flippase-like domain-containing protein [Solirubrobacter ginsenosidimutans]